VSVSPPLSREREGAILNAAQTELGYVIKSPERQVQDAIYQRTPQKLIIEMGG
jgi:hypothetical protein